MNKVQLSRHALTFHNLIMSVPFVCVHDFLFVRKKVEREDNGRQQNEMMDKGN